MERNILTAEDLMITGYQFIRSDEYCEKALSGGKLITIEKIFADDSLEIVKYTIMEDCQVHLRPPVRPGMVKSYLILNGELTIMTSQAKYTTGDLVIVHPDSEWLAVALKKDTQFLIHTYGESAYESTSNYFRAAYDVLNQIQKKDHYTNQHNQRVHELTKRVALKAGFTGNKYRNVLYAARFHDVGKIYIPDQILNKPSSLSEEEYQIMKTHVVHGKELITEHIGEDVYQIMVQHHERLDGSGYPFGLKGDQISAQGRILAVLDTYDAMTTERVYKPGKSPQDAVDELYALSDKYCSSVVDLLVEVLQEDGLL